MKFLSFHFNHTRWAAYIKLLLNANYDDKNLSAFSWSIEHL